MICQKCNRRYVHERCFYCQPVAPSLIGTIWDTGAGNWWRVLAVEGNRVQVECVREQLSPNSPCKGTFWWALDSLTNGRRVPDHIDPLGLLTQAW